MEIGQRVPLPGRVRAMVGGSLVVDMIRVVAESTRPNPLFETNLPTRYYGRYCLSGCCCREVEELLCVTRKFIVSETSDQHS